MKIELLCIGKIQKPSLKEGIDEYVSRLQHYLPFSITELKEDSQKDSKHTRLKESQKLLDRLNPHDYVICWDERGKDLSSEELSTLLGKCQLQGVKKVVMVLGGAYGLSEGVRKRANKILSLSKMTFPHQLVRLILVEQIYRAMTILKGEPYHHS